MFHRGPVVITSLEEDFKKIGLIAKDTAKVENTEEPEVEAPAAATEPSAEEPDGELDEAARRIRRRTVAGGRKLASTKRTSASKRMKSKRSYRKGKIKIKLNRKKKMRNAKFRRRSKFLAKRAAARREGVENDKIAGLMEDIASIVGTTPSADTEVIKGFANIAIISDMLSTIFIEWSERLDEDFADQETYDALAESAESLEDLAEAAAEIATALKDGQELEEQEGVTLESLFKDYMTDLLAAMDLYNEAKGAAVVEGDDDEDEGDEDDDEDEGDEDDDEQEESKKKGKK